MVYQSVPAVLLVDCDSPVDMLCVVSSCSVTGCWPVFLSSFHLPSCLRLVWFHLWAAFSLGLFTIGS